ncbi:40S ribosomal protein S15 [Symbiodinium microadriaticum]|uniref:40S ribosomal protein S15 n=1 Tax=Symbiodinium microadriaticum TaxID=2951 RepID=A0A1Q9CBS8_SYMMI|nr:40S ribosomal protein S15 [Symbiodinium microadriaticum]
MVCFAASGLDAPKKRTFKKYSYSRGIDLDKLLDMSNQDLMELFCARQRRKFSRGIKRKPITVLKKLRKVNSWFLFSGTWEQARTGIQAKRETAYGEKPEDFRDLSPDLAKTAVKTHLRNMVIVHPGCSVVGVYNGKQQPGLDSSGEFFKALDPNFVLRSTIAQDPEEMIGHYLGEFSITYKKEKDVLVFEALFLKCVSTTGAELQTAATQAHQARPSRDDGFNIVIANRQKLAVRATEVREKPSKGDQRGGNLSKRSSFGAMAARELEVPIADEAAANTAAPAPEEADGGGLKELLDVPWITCRTGVDLIVITVLGIALGLISVPYCLELKQYATSFYDPGSGLVITPDAGPQNHWRQGRLEHFGPPGLIDNVHNLSFCAGSTNWILLCWGFCTIAGALKASLDLDKYPSFIDELKHQHSDPIVSLKVVVCCIASLAAGAVMGLEAGLGSVGGALGYLTFRGMERCMPSEDEGAADLRRRTYILAGLAAAFGTILPAPFVAMILVAEIASAGTERHASEDEFMTGRRLPRKVLAFLVPAATASFVMRWAIVATPLTSHPYYAKPYDNLSVFLGLGLGLLAAAAALIFVLLGAIIKVIFGLIGRPLERRLGKRPRQVVLASLAGLITGVATFMYPLAISSGKSAMEPTMKFALFLTTTDLLGAAVAKCVAYWACAHGGLVGGIFFPLLYYGLTLGEVCAKVFNISRAVAVPVMLGAVPGALLPAPLTALSFPVGLFVTGPVQTVPILVAIVTASMLLVGSGFLEKLMVKRA